MSTILHCQNIELRWVFWLCLIDQLVKRCWLLEAAEWAFTPQEKFITGIVLGNYW